MCHDLKGIKPSRPACCLVISLRPRLLRCGSQFSTTVLAQMDSYPGFLDITVSTTESSASDSWLVNVRNVWLPGSAGYGSSTVMSTRIVPSLELYQNWNTYKYRMETIFQPPFNGSGYFRAAWDDQLKIDVTPLDPQGAEAGSKQVLYDTGYTHR